MRKHPFIFSVIALVFVVILVFFIRNRIALYQDKKVAAQYAIQYVTEHYDLTSPLEIVEKCYP